MSRELVGFEHLHLHTDFSLLDGYGMVEEYAERAPQINQKFLTISDHGMMAAIPRQIKACEEHGLNPIYACELYVHPTQPEVKSGEKIDIYTKEMSTDERKAFRKSYHLLAIAYNEVGYSNLVHLCSWGWTKGFYAKPRVNHDQLMRYKEGIIFTSCCYNGEIGQAFDRGGSDAAFQMLEKYMAMFGEHFYLELMLLDFSKQKPYDAWLIQAHEKYKVPLIITNDCHYCNAADSHMQRLMLMIQTKRTIKEIQKILAENQMADMFELQDSNLWMKSEEEINLKWEQDYSDVIDYDLFKQAKQNTIIICEKAKGVELDRSFKLPQVPEDNEVLKEEVIKGFDWRCLPKNKEYLNRIKEEYSLITRKGFSSYFLIQKMMTDEARRVAPEILGWGDGSEAVGPGRGCLHPNSNIISGNGKLVPINLFKAGEHVITLDGSLQIVEEVYEYPCDETLVNIKTYFGDISLTLDHKVYAKKTGQLDWYAAQDVAGGDYVYSPFPKNMNFSDYLPLVNLHNLHRDSSPFGAVVLDKSGLLLKVKEVSAFDYKGPVYDLKVQNNHNYMTDAFLVHNSGAGSLICYCLGITDIDPIKHDLLFSRFLSESRGGKSMKIRFSTKPESILIAS